MSIISRIMIMIGLIPLVSIYPKQFNAPESIDVQCYSEQGDTYWRIGQEYGSSRISDCHPNAEYNCHGFSKSYYENDCVPVLGSNISAPYTCPNIQGVKSSGSITSNERYIQVCAENDADLVLYGLYGGDTHSAIKVNTGGSNKYISKYGTDGPLVSHNLNGSFYHYTTTITNTQFWTYIGGISGESSISGTSPQVYSVLNKSGVTYSWSIISGGQNIYISSSNNQSSVTLTPIHSGSAQLRITVSSSCGTSKSQTLNLTIATNICLEGTYTNAGSSPINLNTSNSVSIGSVMVTVTCPNAVNYSWQRTSGSLSYYSSGANLSFTMTSGASVSFSVTARNSSNTILGTRNISFYNYGSFMVYPNPASTTLYVDLIDSLTVDVIIFNESRSQVISYRNHSGKSGLDISTLEPGNYILKVIMNNKILSEQRIKIEK